MHSVVGASFASVALAAVLACLAEVAVLRAETGGGRLADMALDRLLARLDLDLQACLRVRRTPVLEPHVNSRTNKLLSPKMERAGQLAELFYVSLEW